MKKKRIAAGILCAVLATATVLSGCGGKKTSESSAGSGQGGAKTEGSGEPAVYKSFMEGRPQLLII
ncbi:hypothetical protein [Lacrimispora xylanisolvens]|uniref:hypothetical protein n=1 Tax=Lacrimispora xylanisolvens TaxID=384636 RepID=UPI002402BF06